MKKFNDINQSDSAKRKLKTISKNNNLPLEFVTILYQFYWDLDLIRPTESIGWVHKEQYSTSQLEQGAEKICDYLNIEKSQIQKSKKELVLYLLNFLDKIDENKYLDQLLIAGETGNKCYLSEFSTIHYFNNYSEENLMKLGRKNGLIDPEDNSMNQDENYNLQDFMWFLFLKVFRAGAIERDSLFYCYTDLAFSLPYEKALKPKNNWIHSLTTKIENLENPKLPDLIKSCKSIIKGDKHFKQSVLEALSYSGHLKVNGIDVSNIFIPFYKDELASNYYSNEWRYPLRMWNENN